MLYELRTTRVRPGGLPDFEKRLGEALASRQQHSRLAGCWQTEIGPLLQVIELWPYEDQKHYDDVSEAVAVQAIWPPLHEAARATETEILHPAPFMRQLDGTPQNVGPVFELRIYQVKSGKVQDMIDAWAPRLPGREKFSPLLGCWYSDLGRWFHLWPYPDIAARFSTRAEAQQSGSWPPPTTPFLLTMENKIMLPLSFSPIQ